MVLSQVLFRNDQKSYIKNLNVKRCSWYPTFLMIRWHELQDSIWWQMTQTDICVWKTRKKTLTWFSYKNPVNSCNRISLFLARNVERINLIPFQAFFDANQTINTILLSIRTIKLTWMRFYRGYSSTSLSLLRGLTLLIWRTFFPVF